MDRAEKIAAFERFDGFSAMRNGLRKVATMRGDWAGIPMPLEDRQLVIEPTYPSAAELMAIGAKSSAATDENEGWTLRNKWWCDRERATILIFEKDGKIDWGKHHRVHSLSMLLATFDCADAWGIEQEGNAVQTLGTLIRHRQLKQYLLTGMFIETSKRSGVTYIFRRLRPTIAFRDQRILAALCMHPIGYYAETWAGAMCPTDDVIAHLMLMRGDERMFWRRCNQHHPATPEAGL